MPTIFFNLNMLTLLSFFTPASDCQFGKLFGFVLSAIIVDSFVVEMHLAGPAEAQAVKADTYVIEALERLDTWDVSYKDKLQSLFVQ